MEERKVIITKCFLGNFMHSDLGEGGKFVKFQNLSAATT
jgi:hypothetical protein